MDGETETVEAVTLEEAPQTETDTQLTEERIKAMIAEARADGKAEAEKAYKGIQRAVSKKDRELEELRQKVSSMPAQGSTLTQELMLKELKEMDADNPRIAVIERTIQLENQKREAQVKYDQQQQEARLEKAKLEEQIEVAGFDPTDKRFRRVWRDWKVADKLDGDWSVAQEELADILETLAPKPEPKVNEEEEARAKAEAEGKLKTDTGGPAGGSTARQQIIERWMANPNDKNTTAYMELRRAEGR